MRAGGRRRASPAPKTFVGRNIARRALGLECKDVVIAPQEFVVPAGDEQDACR
jgi:hypothetical protein